MDFFDPWNNWSLQGLRNPFISEFSSFIIRMEIYQNTPKFVHVATKKQESWFQITKVGKA